jgi:hypothetical protein
VSTAAITAPFRCAACGPIDSVNLVKNASVWYRVRLDAGAVIADTDSQEFGEEQGTERFECASCCGSAARADGSPIVVEGWV